MYKFKSFSSASSSAQHFMHMQSKFGPFGIDLLRLRTGLGLHWDSEFWNRILEIRDLFIIHIRRVHYNRCISSVRAVSWLLVAVLSLQSQATKITEIVQRAGYQQKMCSTTLKEKTINKLKALSARFESQYLQYTVLTIKWFEENKYLFQK